MKPNSRWSVFALLVLLAAFCMWSVPQGKAANLVLNGSFEDNVVTWASVVPPTGPFTISNWQVDVRAVFLFRTPQFATDGAQGVVMLGNSQLSQWVPTVPGLKYDFAFDLIGTATQPTTVNYTITGFSPILATSYTGIGDPPVTVSTSFEADSPLTEIRFIAPWLCQGLAIDNVRMSVAVAPEPGTYALLGGLGLLGFACYRRMRR